MNNATRTAVAADRKAPRAVARAVMDIWESDYVCNGAGIRRDAKRASKRAVRRAERAAIAEALAANIDEEG